MSEWPNVVQLGAFLADNDADDFRVTAKVTGWGAAPVRSGVADRAQQDGGWDAASYRSSRVVTIEGMVEQPNHLEAQNVADALAALPVNVLILLTVTNEAIGVRTALVRLDVGAEPEWLGPTGFTYTVQVIAPDVLKYGTVVTMRTVLTGADGSTGRVWPRVWPRSWGLVGSVTAGSVVMPNGGTAPYWPTLRIDGPVPNPVITQNESGDFIRIAYNLLAGQWIDVDLGNRRVLLNGQISLRNVTTFGGTWLAIPPGGGSISWTADGADPAAQLTVHGFEGSWQ